MPPLVEIGLTDLPKTGEGAYAPPPAPPLETCLHLVKINLNFVVLLMFCFCVKLLCDCTKFLYIYMGCLGDQPLHMGV